LRIAVRPRHACRARADFGLKGRRQTATDSRQDPRYQLGTRNAKGNGFEARSPVSTRNAECERQRIRGKTPRLASLARDDSTRGAGEHWRASRQWHPAKGNGFEARPLDSLRSLGVTARGGGGRALAGKPPVAPGERQRIRGKTPRLASLARGDNLTTHGEIPPLAALGRDDTP